MLAGAFGTYSPSTRFTRPLNALTQRRCRLGGRAKGLWAALPGKHVPNYECPTCNKTITVASAEDAPFRPFCCQRCKLIDLGRWFDGTYKISEPAKPEDDVLETDEHE